VRRSARPSGPARRLRDIVAPGLRVLFIGINPSLTSARVGHHFASPGNPFWRLLRASGLVPIALSAVDDRRLLQFGLGLTNLCPRPTRSAAELSPAELAAGARTLRRKIARLRPRVVVPVGLTVYTRLVGGVRSGGAGEKPETIAGAPIFALPNPSGLNASFPGFQHKLVWFEALREYLTALSPAGEAGRSARSDRARGDRPPRRRAPGRARGGS
jgi:double-stranded uracil-DNA glycosylase